MYCLVTNHFFFKKWVNQNILFVSDFFSAQGDRLSFSDFMYLKNTINTLRDFNNVTKSIPVSVKTLIEAHLRYGCLNNYIHLQLLVFMY